MAKQLDRQMQESDSSEEQESDASNDDFFTKAEKRREIVSDDEEVQVIPTKLSKRKMSKITADGPYQGKNVIVFAEDGRQVSKDSYERQKYLASLKVNMRQESDVESDSDEQQNYLENVRQQLQKNQSKDTELAKLKLKEKRLKTKKRRRALEGEPGQGAELASYHGSQQSELSQSDSGDAEMASQSDDELDSH